MTYHISFTRGTQHRLHSAFTFWIGEFSVHGNVLELSEYISGVFESATCPPGEVHTELIDDVPVGQLLQVIILLALHELFVFVANWTRGLF